jgi:hypothetical protein
MVLGLNSIFDLAKGTEFEPKTQTKCPEPDPFIQYNDIIFGIGMDDRLYVYENGYWRKAEEVNNYENSTGK